MIQKTDTLHAVKGTLRSQHTMSGNRIGINASIKTHKGKTLGFHVFFLFFFKALVRYPFFFPYFRIFTAIWHKLHMKNFFNFVFTYTYIHIYNCHLWTSWCLWQRISMFHQLCQDWKCNCNQSSFSKGCGRFTTILLLSEAPIGRFIP